MSGKEKNDDSMIFSTKQMSAILGLSDRRIRQLENEGALVKVAHGKFDLPASIQQYIEHIKEQAMNEEELDFTQERTLLTRANREKVELELQIMKGEVHRSDDIRLVMNDMLGSFRARCLSIPSKAAPKIMAQTDLAVIQNAIKEEVFEALSELSDYDPEIFYSHSNDKLALNLEDVEDESEEEPKKEKPKQSGRKKEG